MADAQAALERGRSVVLVRPPAAEQALELWDLIATATPVLRPGVGCRAVILCDAAAALEWAAAAPAALRFHAVTGLARSARLLKESAVDVLAATVTDVAALVERAALKLDQVATLIVAWPEALVAHEYGAVLDALLADARDARRIVLSWNPAALRDFLERHGRRALVLGTPPVDDTGALLPPVCRARYCLVPWSQRQLAVRDALDTLNATHPFIWQGGPIPAATADSTAPDAVLCTRLPTRDDLAALARLGVPVVFLAASQLPYLRSVAALTPFPLPSGADRGRDRAEALRARVARRLEAGGVDAELALLDPLFERFDAAEVAAALLALLGDERASPPGAGALPGPAPGPTVKVFVNVGKKDRAAAKDLVGALIREAGMAKGDIGRIDVRDTFSLVEVTVGAAEQAVRRLTGVTIRGRRVLARLDRQA
ncbi:MAG TPA: DbpA RNA binding domain-containing protein [Gemmatimonadales bacterium]|nr:DbpA RNA binding domain-containing protein [Gemmatimonadales bacterium]